MKLSSMWIPSEPGQVQNATTACGGNLSAKCVRVRNKRLEDQSVTYVFEYTDSADRIVKTWGEYTFLGGLAGSVTDRYRKRCGAIELEVETLSAAAKRHA